MFAGTWFDMVLGLDIHFELVPAPPAPPIPTPLPNPFFGLVYDPMGLAANLAISAAFGSGKPVLVNYMYAATTGTEAKDKLGVPHMPMPPGIAWAPFPKAPKPPMRPGPPPPPDLPIPPPGDAILITGSQTVHAMGSNMCRLGDMAMSCSDPVRMPSSTLLAVPKGMPVMVGGPPAVDWAAAAFAFLRSKWISNRLHEMLGFIKNDRLRNLVSKAICFLTGHPVDVATGRMMTWATDLALPGPLAFTLERNYSSAWSSRDSTCGFGWSHSFDQAVWRERGKVVYRDGEGREIEFHTLDLPDRVLRAGQEMFDPISRLTLRCKDVSRWEIEDAIGLVLELEPVEPGGRVARLVRKRTPDGHAIQVTYDQKGRPEWVRDSAGRLIGFEHDAVGHLVRVLSPHPSQDGWYAHRRYVYSPAGDLLEAHDALGNVTRYEYEDHLMVKETDRNGLSFYFGYDGRGSGAYCIRTWGDGGIFDHEIAYDKANRLTVVTDSVGASTCYFMNEATLVTKVVDPHGAETIYQYDDALRRVSVTEPDSGKSEYQYDARGNLTFAVTADGAVSKIDYNDMNRPVHVVEPTGGEWRWAYDRHGHLVSESNPAGSVVERAYHDGLLRRVTHPDGSRTEFSYDEQKLVRSVQLTGGAVFEFVRDRMGRITSVRTPNKSMLHTQWDAESRVLRVQDRDGQATTHRLDAEGNVVEKYDTAGRHVRYAYAGFYDLVRTEEAGTTVHYEYDTESRLKGIVNETGERQSFTLDECGRVVEEKRFDGIVRKLQRDKAGRVNEVRFPSGRVTSLAYDAVGRCIGADYGSGEFMKMEYRLDGTVSRMENQRGAIETERDVLGRVIRESWQGTSIERTYDAGSQPATLSSSLGFRESFVRDPGGDLKAMQIGGDRIEFSRDALGLEVSRRLPGGVVSSWERDIVGRPTVQRTVVQGVERDARSYRWSAGEWLEAIVDTTKGPTFYEYDALRRVVGQRSTDSVVTRMLDPAGRVYQTFDRSDRTYAAGGRLERDDDWLYTYDGDGFPIEKRHRRSAETFAYRWTKAGELAEVTRPDGLLVRFEYDPLGRRTAKKVLRATESGELVEREVSFIWNADVPLHEVVSGGKTTTWLFTPEQPEIVGKIDDERMFGAITDDQGVPTELYDDVGHLAWQMQLDVFGAGKPDVQETACPWRFPGQYEDEETGLYYNRFRYYDPCTGRYISPDRLGVLGGLDLYGYVADPLTEQDFYGDDGHHTIPNALVQSMQDMKLVTKDAVQKIKGYGREGLFNVAHEGHVAVHSVMADALGVANRASKEQWKDYLKSLTGDKVNKALRELGDVYRKEMRASGQFTEAEIKRAIEAFEHDAKIIRGCKR